jgi:hypothetical protein
MKETPITSDEVAEFTRTNMVFGRNEDGELILTGLNCRLNLMDYTMDNHNYISVLNGSRAEWKEEIPAKKTMEDVPAAGDHK